MRLLMLLAVLLLAVPGRAAPPDTTSIQDAAQDEGGQVWGAKGYVAGGRLCRWRGGRWQDVPMPFAEGREAVALARGDDGRVYCVWESPLGPDCLVSVHAGGASRLLARFPGAMRRDNGTLISPNLYVGRDGAAWVAGQSDRFWRVTPDGRARAFPLSAAWFLPGRTPQKQDNYYDPTGSVVDGRGRRWFWSNDLGIDTLAACLRGVLIWDGRHLISHPKLPGVPDRPFSVIAPEDARRLWLAVPGDGLYEVDAATLHGRRVLPPERGAFRAVLRIFRAGGDWYLMDGAATPGERSVVLWRRRGGRWRKIVPGLDKSNGANFQQPGRPWLATPSGVWVGAIGGGAWWLPARGGPAVPVDWRRGFPLGRVGWLFRLTDGRLLGAGEASAAFAPDPPAPLPRPSPLARTFLTGPGLTELVPDARRHLWSVLAGDPQRLSEWDGQTWRKHPIPKGVPLDKLFLFAWDTLGRLWLLPWNHDGPAAVFAPATEAWVAYPTCEAAYQAQSAVVGFALRPWSPQPMPRYGPGGRICFTTQWEGVHLFDGRAWHEWTLGQIVGVQGAAISSQSFFNRAGNPALTWQGKTWQWTSEKGWLCGALEAGPPNDPQGAPDPPPAPLGSPAPHPDSVALDGPDVAWLTYDRQLYKVAFGVAAPQFAPGTAHPFLDGRSLHGALHDGRGNTFLSTTGAWYTELVLLPAAPPPDTQVAATPTSPNAVRVEVTTHAPEPHRFVWRVDGGKWSVPARGGTVTLDFLPGGPHRVEALALDERLNYGPVPALAAFVVRADPAAQVSNLVGMLLAGGSDDREKAVTKLRQFPTLAPPALRSALPSADEDQRWWVEAAMQEIEADRKGDQAPAQPGVRP